MVEEVVVAVVGGSVEWRVFVVVAGNVVGFGVLAVWDFEEG